MFCGVTAAQLGSATLDVRGPRRGERHVLQRLLRERGARRLPARPRVGALALVRASWPAASSCSAVRSCCAPRTRGSLGLAARFARSGRARRRSAAAIAALPVWPESSMTCSSALRPRARELPGRARAARRGRAGRGSGRRGCPPGGPRRGSARPPRATRRWRSSGRRCGRTRAARLAAGRYTRRAAVASSEMTASSHASQSCAARMRDLRVGVLHAPRVGGDEVAVGLGLRHARAEALPRLGEEPPDAPVEPVDLRAPGRRHAHEHDLRDALGMALGVGERRASSPTSRRRAASARCRGARAGAPCRRSGGPSC